MRKEEFCLSSYQMTQSLPVWNWLNGEVRKDKPFSHDRNPLTRVVRVLRFFLPGKDPEAGLEAPPNYVWLGKSASNFEYDFSPGSTPPGVHYLPRDFGRASERGLV